MNIPPHDDDLRQRLRDACRREQASAPDFERVLRGRDRGSKRGTAVFAIPRLIAVAAVIAALAALVLFLRPGPEGKSGSTIAQRVAPAVDESFDDTLAEEWALPTDGLLADADEGAAALEVERLSREITALLQR
jgi:hypothetical protein